VGVREDPKLLKINDVMGSEELVAQQIAGDILEKNSRLTEKKLLTAQMRNHRPYNRRIRHRRLSFGDSVLLWAPTGQNRSTFVWRGIVGRLGNDEYSVEISPRKVETYHVIVNLLKTYYCEQRLILTVSTKVNK